VNNSHDFLSNSRQQEKKKAVVDEFSEFTVTSPRTSILFRHLPENRLSVSASMEPITRSLFSITHLSYLPAFSAIVLISTHTNLVRPLFGDRLVIPVVAKALSAEQKDHQMDKSNISAFLLLLFHSDLARQ